MQGEKRILNGKLFYRVVWCPNEDVAKDEARSLQRQGYIAKVVKERDGWFVCVRPKSPAYSKSRSYPRITNTNRYYEEEDEKTKKPKKSKGKKIGIRK